MNDHKDSWTGLWALDALEPHEREQFLRHLEQHPETLQEARSFQETAAELGASLPPLTPPPALKTQIMDQVRHTRQLPPQLPEPTGTDAAVIPLATYRASVRRSRWTTVAASILLLTTIATGTLLGLERRHHEQMGTEMTAMASAQETAAQERAMLTQIMAAPDSAHMIVPAEAGGSLTLMWSRQEEMMFIETADLPALADDETYQVWMMDGDDVHSAGMIDDPQDAVMMHGEIPEGSMIALSIEPTGGSTAPTTDLLAAGVL